MTVKEGEPKYIGPYKMTKLSPVLGPNYYEHLIHDKKPGPASKAGVELDKFKRRLIRSVARLLLHDKKPEDEIWKELKKETGCDCELLWLRMRALTIKKLDVLLSADDRMHAVPKPARMSFTDWLLFDLVLVHQKIDLIGQDKEKNKDCQALVDLFELVKQFNIEYLSGEKLAEAWSSATLTYNNKGHHCSPMLLQRRWYQLKELTRTKFYGYWYAYRGSVQRISSSEPFKPSPLQTEIATTYKLLITKRLPSWEELIQCGKVTMPDQFERLMQEKLARMNPAPAPKPIEDVPDLVMIEPNVETIDLRVESDEDVNEENKQEEDELANPEPPLIPPVKIKQEPLEDMDIDETQVQLPKKSIYEVVLETTTLENEQLDKIDTEDYVPENYDGEVEEIEEIPARDEEESTLPQIGSVFGNVSDTSVLANIDEDRVYANAGNTEVCGNDNDSTVVNVDSYVHNDKNAGEGSNTIVLDDVDDNAQKNGKEIVASVNINESGVGNNDEVIELSDKDKDAVEINDSVEEVTENVGETSPVDGDIITLPGDVNVISDDDDNNLGQVDISSTTTIEDTNVDSTVENTGVIGTIDETTIVGNVKETSVSENVRDTIEPVVSKEVAVLDAPTTTSAVTDSPSKDLEIIDTPSDPVEIINSDDEGDIVNNLLKAVTKSTVEDIMKHRRSIVEVMEVDSPTGRSPEPLVTEVDSPTGRFPEPLKVNLKESAEISEEKDVKQDIPGFNFGELPNDISFADEGIELVDDGIVYVDEDGLNEPNIKTEAEDEETPLIDPKLLMCPIVYTTRLDDMYSFHRRPFYHVKDKHLIHDINIKSKPIKQEPKEPEPENITVNYVGDDIASVTVNNTETIEHVQKSVGTIEKVAINNDSIVIIKKEPVNVESETSENVEQNPENDDNVMSDDDESDTNVIDESQKVKPTSYLLQKPRSRRYNPIQLCKNPDFNTRLKRLSVGFFSSPRNRILIKSCKPLTIDLSKAFESKLVSGTLYLKPVDHNVVTEIRDDTESQNVSVLPSAMPAQSLIDNSKAADALPMLRQCLEASQQSQESNTNTIERNKVINLPDITEIRRINQKLLTAEVTPIQVHNNQPQVPVSIVTASNTPTCTAQKTVSNPEHVEGLRPIAPKVNDARGPPKLLDITGDLPPNSSATQYPTITISNSNTNTSSARNSFHTFRPQAPGLAGRPPKIVNGKRVIPQKPPVWKPRQLRLAIPWLTKTNVDTMMNETLLTMDALHKMLFLLNKESDSKKDGNSEKNPKPKVKKKNAAQQTNKQRGRPKTNPSAMRDPAKEDESNETQNTFQKPKINIKAATNYPRGARGKIGDDPSKQKIKYCCWARQRMLQLLFGRQNIPPHDCPRLCACCCRHLLADYILQDKKIKDAEYQKLKAAENAFDITEDTIESEDSNSSVLCEVFVPIPAETPAQVPAVTVLEDTPAQASVVTVPQDTPAAYIDIIDNVATGKNIENEPISIDDTEDDVPALGSEVSVETSTVVKTTAVVSSAPRGIPAPVTVRRTLVAVPLPKSHNLISRETPEVVKPPYRITRRVSSDKQPGGDISITPNSTKTRCITVGPNIDSAPTISKLLEARKLRTPSKFKTSTPPPNLFSNANKPFMPPKNFKEKMIFLNSKQISEKPTASPIFLGKNKILLTTVKFPPNLKLFQESKKALRKSFILPNGVHLILQTDGKISYKIDQNVEVNAMDMAGMSEIIATVQAHMDAQEEAQKLQKSPLASAATESEIVDLVDDDDEPASNSNDHQQNTDTHVESQLQPTAERVKKISDDSPDVGHNSIMDTSKEMEENAPDVDTSSNVLGTATESNQIKTTDQCTVTGFQENQVNIQDSSHTEMVPPSTEQVEPDPSIEKVSAEIDGQAKSSNETVTTDVVEVSAEQLQDQSKPSIETESTDVPAEPIQHQNVNIQVQDHPEPTTQNVSTEVPEESRSELSRPKTKNILSDLMEMSGIFDEDMTSEVVAPSVTPQTTTEVPVPAGTPIMQPSSSANILPESPPTVSSPLGELTPITSLYELKYACANKGTFFKLDFKTGFFVPINVCMKPATPKPPPLITRRIAPKSVIDLTDDDDKQEQNDKQLEISPTKSNSLLMVNNSSPGGLAATDKPGSSAVTSGNFAIQSKPSGLAGSLIPADLAGPSKPISFAGPVKPIKLFKSLKPNILQRLNINKTKKDGWNPLFDRVSLDQSIKRKQFLKAINMNADLAHKPIRRYVRKTKHADKAVDQPTATTSSSEPVKEFATTILSDDDSSDDEPLAKIAKRKNENVNAPDQNKNTDESVTNDFELELPVAVIEQEASVEKQIEPELPVADDENNMLVNDIADSEPELPVAEDENNMLVYDTADGEPELPVADDENNMLVDDTADGEPSAKEQNDAELPEADSGPVDMSDDDNEFMENETFGFDLNDSNEEEDCCILGV